MLQMNQHYEPEFKKKIVRLHLEEGRSLKGLAAEYGVSKNLFEKSIILMAEWMGTEPCMLILFVKGTISVV